MMKLRKTISWLLIIVFVLSLVPFSVFSEGEGINIEITAEYKKEWRSGAYNPWIELSWGNLEEASGYNVYIDDIKVNEDVIESVAEVTKYDIDQNKDKGIDLERDELEDREGNVRVEAVNVDNEIIGEGIILVTIPRMPYIEWIKINGEDVTDEYYLEDIDNYTEIQIKFSHQLKTNWRRPGKPVNYIQVKKQGAYKEMLANFEYDEENYIYTLKPWGGLVSGEIYRFALMRNLTDIYNDNYLESNEEKDFVIKNNVDDRPFEVESIKTTDGRDFTDNKAINVPVDTKLIIAFNKLIDIETYEEDDTDGKYDGIYLTTREDGSKGFDGARLMNTQYETIEDNGEYKSVLTVEPKMATDWSTRGLDENTDYYVVVEEGLADAYKNTVGENKIYHFKTVDPKKSIYEFEFEVPEDVVTRDEYKVDVTFKANEIKEEGYDRVIFNFSNQSTDVGTVIFKATAIDEVEHTFINSGTWGPETGFPVANNYDETTEFTLIFDKAGDYIINFEAIDLEQESAIIFGSTTINVEPKEVVKLLAPVVILDKSTISWDAIENAAKYQASIVSKEGGIREIETMETSLDLEEIEPKLKPGLYTITVIALPEEGSEDYIVSDSSNKIQYFVEAEIPILEDITPSEDVELQEGDTLEVSFTGPEDGEAYFNLRLPLGLSSIYKGKIIEETEPGRYEGEWIVPEGILAENLIVDIVFTSKEGVTIFKTAEGKVTIVGIDEPIDPGPTDEEPMENLPANTVIVGNEAFDIRYLNSNGDAQRKLINWNNEGNEVYIKLSEDRIVNIRGQIVSIDELPGELIYYDVDGNTTIYVK